MDPSQILSQILAAAGVPAGQLAPGADLSVGNILRSLFILVVIYIVARWVRNLLAGALERLKLEPRAANLVLRLVFYGIIALGVIWILGGFGLSVVVLGVVVGFALKDLIENFAAGLLIMGTRPFHTGDWVVIDSNEGLVVDVGWRGTFLDTFDGRRVIVPNSSVVKTVVVNNSLKPQLRSTLNLSVDPGADFGALEQQILDALEKIPGISNAPPPAVMIDSLSGSALNLSVLLWVTDPVHRQKQVISQALRAIQQALPARNNNLNLAATLQQAPAE
jgi:small-conductance mechanosensitive channel